MSIIKRKSHGAKSEPLKGLALKRHLERSVRDLPVLPTVVAKMMTLNRKDEDYFDKILTLVESDPNFSARVLATANSSANAPAMPVGTVRTALARIGSAGAANHLMAIGVARVFVPRDPWERSLWTHALQVATTCQQLAEHYRDIDVLHEEAYLCGLLHDVGRFIMFLEAPEQLRTIDESDWETPEKLVEYELSICGLNHADLGALACTRWKLPEHVVEVVRNHHKAPSEAPKSKIEKLSALIHLADMAMFQSAMPGTLALYERNDAELEQALASIVPPFVRETPCGLRALFQQSAAHAEETCAMLGISG